MSESNTASLVRRSVVLVALLTSFGSAQASTFVVTDATIRAVTNTGNNLQNFVIEVVGGTGPCASASGTFITFPLSAAVDVDSHKRAYAAAMLALATGMRVRVYNYASSACDGAAYIEVRQ